MKAPKIHQCGVCKNWYSRTGDLRRHYRIHTGERPYACKWPGCTKSFTQRSGLKAHIPVHTGEKKYHCGIGSCTSEFGDASSCGRHRREGHPPIQITHQCPIQGCRSRIKRVSSFRTHLKKHQLDPDGVELDSCVVVVSRDDLEEDADFLQVPRIRPRRQRRSAASSRYSSPVSPPSSVSSLDDVSNVASPYEESPKDFLGMGFSDDVTCSPASLSPLAFETLTLPSLEISQDSAQWCEQRGYAPQDSPISVFEGLAFPQYETYTSSPSSSLGISPIDTWSTTSFEFLLEGPVFPDEDLSFSLVSSEANTPSSPWMYQSALGVQF